MAPSQKPAGILRKIIGFHPDKNSEWIAELECGHQQHVRHNPPWVNRPWIATPEGRVAYLGHQLLCTICVPESDA
jgi:hypothetical protein